jgi:biopolymer transport protein ExbB
MLFWSNFDRYPSLAITKSRPTGWLLFAVFAFFIATGNLALAQETAGGSAKPDEEVNVLFWLIQVSGWIGAFILLLSIYFGSVVVRSFLDLRLQVAAPPDTVAAVENLIQEKNPREIVKILQVEDSFYGKILLEGISDLRYGLDEARDRLERKADALTGDMERSISILAVLGTLGPMIGLLGTLKGMITSFSAIAISGVALDPSKVALGISEALVLTFEGVGLSVPAIYFFSFFRNRIAKIHSEVSMIADDHLRQIARLLKGKPSSNEEVPS